MNFRDELKELINRHGLEKHSNTPNFILAEYLNNCLDVFDEATNAKEKWYGRKITSQRMTMVTANMKGKRQ